MRIIPAIDIINGQCVRLIQGDYARTKVYDYSPVDMAKTYEDLGFSYLHLVDLDGAKSHSPNNLVILNQIALQTNLTIDFGGGIKSEDSLIQALRSGASQVTVGSIAASNPVLVKFWIQRFGADRIIIGADIKERMIAVNGWQEVLELDILSYIGDFAHDGAKTFVCTDIALDGMMKGSAVDLYAEILDHFPEIKLVASGGISTMKEIDVLQEIGLDGAIIGKAIYENLIDLKELASWAQSH